MQKKFLGKVDDFLHFYSRFYVPINITTGRPVRERRLDEHSTMAEPGYATQIRQLAENLDQFDFIPDVRTPMEYGRFMIQESGRFEYDPNLDGFYDYEGFGLQRMEQESGMFIDCGYIS